MKMSFIPAASARDPSGSHAAHDDGDWRASSVAGECR